MRVSLAVPQASKSRRRHGETVNQMPATTRTIGPGLNDQHPVRLPQRGPARIHHQLGQQHQHDRQPAHGEEILHENARPQAHPGEPGKQEFL